MKHLAELILVLSSIVSWLAGIVLAHGFWSTLFAILMPPWAWLLVTERALMMAGWAT